MDSASPVAPVDRLVRCCLQTGTECDVRWHHFSKLVSLPFFPRIGDRLSINDPLSEDHGSMTVECSDYDIDKGIAYVVLGFRKCENEEQRAIVDEWFVSSGWQRD